MAYVLSSVQNTTTELCSSLVHQIHHLNDYHFKCCLIKTTATVIGGIGAITLMAAPFTKGGISMLSCVAVGSAGTLLGVGINVATDFVISKQSSVFLSQVQEYSKLSNTSTGDTTDLKRIKALSFADPTLLLQMVGIGGPLNELRILSHAAKLVQVHALMVRMFLLNMNLLIKVAYYKTGGQFYKVLNSATSHTVNETLKWVAVGATVVVVLVDFSLICKQIFNMYYGNT